MYNIVWDVVINHIPQLFDNLQEIIKSEERKNNKRSEN